MTHHKENTNRYLLYAFLITITLIIFLPSLKVQYIWDDKTAVENNLAIRTLSNFSTFFTDPDTALPGGLKSIFRPLRTLYFAVVYSLVGSSPFLYHLLNLLFHILICLLLYQYIKTLVPDKLAFFTALLFAVHPIHTESVNLIVGSADLICTIFILLSLLMNQSQIRYHYIFTSLFLFLAMLSKEMGVIGFPLILLDEIYRGHKSFKQILFQFKYFVIIGVTLIYLIFRFNMTGNFQQLGHHGKTWGIHFDFALQGIITYLRILFLPINLKLDYIFFPNSSIFNLTHILILLILIMIFLLLKTKAKIALFSIMWYIIAYLPISNIIPIKTVVSERLLYISSIGFCLFIGSVIYKIWQKKRTVTFMVFSFYIGLLSFLTFFRNVEWVDEEIFWKVNVERAPFSARAHANYASCLEGAGKLKQAQDHLEKAILYNPDQIPFKLGLAALYLNNQMIEKFDEIIKQITLTSIRKQCPRFEISYNSLLEKRHQMN